MSVEKDIIDGEDEEAFRANAGGIPVDFAGQQRSLIHAPNKTQLKLYSQTRVRTCGDCKHFTKRHFESVKDKFVATLIHEQEWKTEFLGSDPDKMGICGAKDAVVTGPTHLACSNYRRR